MILTPLHYLAQGIDFVRQSVNLAFAHGDSRMCHTVNIIRNTLMCEPTTEDFTANLAYVSGTNINIVRHRTQVLIEDSNEPGCGELNT